MQPTLWAIMEIMILIRTILIIRYLSVLRSAIRNNVRIPKRELVKKYNRNNDLIVIDVMII